VWREDDTPSLTVGLLPRIPIMNRPETVASHASPLKQRNGAVARQWEGVIAKRSESQLGWS